MKKNILLSTVLLFLFSLSAIGQKVVKPSGNLVTKEFDFSGITSIEISNDFKAFVRFSENEKVSIETDDNLKDYVYVDKNGNTLKIGLKDNLNIRGKETLVAYISAKMINKFKATDDAIIVLEDDLKGDELSVKLAGDSKFGGTIDVIDLEVNLKSDSEMKVNGKAYNVNANLKGDSILESYDFVISKLKIELFGDSEAYLSVTKALNVKAFGDSVLYYKGDEVVERKILLGDSELVKMD